MNIPHMAKARHIHRGFHDFAIVIDFFNWPRKTMDGLTFCRCAEKTSFGFDPAQRGTNSASARPPADLIPAREGGARASVKGGPNSVAGNPGQTVESQSEAYSQRSNSLA